MRVVFRRGLWCQESALRYTPRVERISNEALRFCFELLEQSQIAVVSLGGDVALRHRLPNGAFRLSDGAAVVEPTLVAPLTHLRKALVEIVGRKRPQTHLSQARR